MQLGPSPQTQEYSRHSSCCVPPAQWGNHYASESGEEECELFGDVPPGREAHQDELDNASTLSVSNSMASNLAGPRCINGQLVRPTPPSDESPFTACQASTVCALGGMVLGQAPPEFGSPPQGHHCPKYHPRRQPGRCAICGSTRHYTSQCTGPVKPKAKSAEWDETTWQQEEEVEWQDSQWETEEYEASKGKKGKER